MNDSEISSLIRSRKIVTYHKIDPVNNLESQFQIYREKNILITVDDGDVSFYDIMFPLIKKYKLTAILFIITDLINTTKPFWWDEIIYYLGNGEGMRKVWEVKSWKNSDRLLFLEELRKNSKKPLLYQKQLTTEQLLEMQNAGIIIANHSHTHPMLDKCSEDEIRTEFQSSRLFFEQNSLRGYNLLAYPNGNYNAEVEKIATEEGIELAFLFDHKVNGKAINPYKISRLSVTEKTSTPKLKFILSGWHSYILPIRKQIIKYLKV